ncbi:alanine racemase [Nocardia seriolae]|uniref:Diaminopimelate decarboxylase n=1 Tax=Nocardia seriolae TaxID=37332 RepID=A0ABC8APS0_9NOCA|nr:alanine racemase [Nocardia seriolae]APA96279.1 Diaminopimelate decarboxylase [Nocardia seriolae]OJF82403.1 amino acid decarboxylase [Nocardia seriolae]WNJ60651.1 alanine racemase [Nocardia seriolae]BAW09341.1 amino acid decarboxylase [Nocardia seriolae]BEK85778.1 Y4yA family PLP-dependent enzyme [Nocardia seriolae]
MVLNASPALPALEPEWQRRLRSEAGLLFDIHHAVGGPFHLLYPDRFEANLAAFQQVLIRNDVPGQVYFGKKANKAGCWLPVVADLGAGVDVASEPELVHALAHGVRGRDIGVTGAAKTSSLLRLAARHDCVVAVDSLDELWRAAEIARTATRLRVLLRVLPPDAPHSRFGLSATDLEAALAVCARARTEIDLLGFSFHLDGYAVEPRATLAYDLIALCNRTKALGLPVRALSIGGGFACRYVDNDSWTEFTANQTGEWFHAGKRFDRFYPYAQAPVGAAMLEDILTTSFDGASLAHHLRDNGIALFLEPGRALLIDTGCTVFPVLGSKRNSAHVITTVHGLSMSVSEQWKGSEFLPDPILVPFDPEPASEPVGSCVGGASCMEYDVLTWRKVPLPQQPRHGDLLIYPNTAGYQMDKNESEFHQLPLPPKIVLTTEAGRLRWRLDR